jgi:2-polyprenyl-3-methyl-5-hydroxy-6-metoxy-1,4-benzoquinol methylase
MNYVDIFLKKIIESNPMQKKVVEMANNYWDDQVKLSFEKYLEFCISQKCDLDYLIDCYNLIVTDTLREQFYFARNKKYRYSSYEEVANSVYLNEDYMRKYMYGLGITSYLWVQHIKYNIFFKETIPKKIKGNYIEIGPGHGHFMLDAIEMTTYDHFVGVDISPTSLNMTKEILKSHSFDVGKKIDLILSDFLQLDNSEKYDALVIGEVLEHVESPIDFIAKIKSITKVDSYIYLTTCINAPAIDHIYLFESVDHLEYIINQGGLYISSKLVIPYPGLSMEDTLKKKLPINIALTLKHE